MGKPSPQTVLITGAASGIGRALASQYAATGRTLLLLDRDSATATEADIRAHHGDGVSVRIAAVDVRDAAEVQTAIDELTGGAVIDRVIHCAGVLPPTRAIADVDPEDVRRVVDINILGSFNVVHAALPYLRPGSHMALVASLGGLIAGYRYAAYSASKFGVVGLAEVLRMELAPMGIRTQVICPGEVTTPMVADELASGDHVQRAVKLLSGPPITAGRAAKLIHGGVESGRFMVIPTARARLLWRIARLTPTPIRLAITDRQIRRAEAALPDRTGSTPT